MFNLRTQIESRTLQLYIIKFYGKDKVQRIVHSQIEGAFIILILGKIEFIVFIRKYI